MKVIYAPENIKNRHPTGISIFLAGTIEMGKSEDWQQKVIEHFKNREGTIYNPRRKNWDSSWEQKKTNPQFAQQVKWELKALTEADCIIFNFLSDSKSPISLLELGLFAQSDHVLVCCPDAFYRSGNVHIVCDLMGIKVFQTMDELLKEF